MSPLILFFQHPGAAFMTFRTRVLTRVGVAALLIAGGLAAAGAPALASGDQADLELAVAGTKVAAGAPGKIGWAKVTNHGPGVPSTLSITADLSEFDVEHRDAAIPVDENCGADEKAFTVTCVIPPEVIPGVGETLEIPVFVVKNPELSEPYQAPVTFSLASPGDTNPANNSRKVDVTFGEAHGVDLAVLVPDVKERIVSFEEGPTGPLRAGDGTVVTGVVFNWGDAAAAGVKLTVQLPEHVTFTEVEPGCAYDAANRRAVCTYDKLVLVPALDGPGNELRAGAVAGGDEDPVALVWFPVKVDAGVKAPVTLPDGAVTVEAMGQISVDSPRARAANRTLPKNIKMVGYDVVEAYEVDGTDNADNFVVVVEGDEGGAGGGGGLPVTGAQAGLIGGIGLAVLVAGGVLMVLARRRRVVLVAPGDETPTS